MRRIGLLLCLITAISPFSVRAATVGYVIRVAVNRYVPNGEKDPDTGIVPMTSGGIYHLFIYHAGTTPVSDEDMYTLYGLRLYYDLDGVTPQRNPNHEYRSFDIVGGFRHYGVLDSITNVVPNGIGDLTRDHYISPIYDQRLDMSPILTDSYGNYQGPNPSYPIAEIQPLQGNIQPPDSVAPQYLYYDSSGAPRLPPSSSPAVQDDGNYIWVYDNTQGWTVTPAYQSSSGGDGGDTPTVNVDLAPVVDAVNAQGALTRQQLVSLLGANGNSWVYDCSLSLQELSGIASNLGLIQQDVDRIRYYTSDGYDYVASIHSLLSDLVDRNIDTSGLATEATLAAFAENLRVSGNGFNYYLQNINSKAQSADSKLNYLITADGKLTNIKTDVAASKGLLQHISDNTDNMDNRAKAILDTLESWEDGNSVSFSGPDFGSDTPNDELPFDASGFNDSVLASLGQLTDWGDNGVAPAFKFDVVSSLLSRMVGTIPSVGTDSRMFSVEFSLPYIGPVQKQFDFSDYPSIPYFRAFLLWVTYLFFGLACFKLLHATII